MKSGEAPTSSAAEVGLDRGRLQIAVDVLKRGIDDGAMPGAVLCAARRGKIFIQEALGTTDGSRRVTLDTIYDLASITKPMATAAAALVLCERGELALATTLPSLLGEQQGGHLANVTVWHLLTHTSGLPAHANCFEKGCGIDLSVAAILQQPAVPPGTKYEYSCLGFILLGRIIEIVSGRPLAEFARENVFAPLGLSDVVGFCPSDSFRSRIAPTKSMEKALAGEESPGTLHGIVNDGNCRAIGGVAGNAGLFGTALDVLKFGNAILRRSPRLFGAPTTARILENQVDPRIGAHSLMFFAHGNGYCPAGDLLSPRTVGHSGFTGTVLTIDPAHDLVAVVLTNRTYNHPSDPAPWLSVRRRFLNGLAGAID